MFPFQIVPTSKEIFHELGKFCHDSIEKHEAANQSDAPNDFIDLYLKKIQDESLSEKSSTFKGQVIH